MVETTELTDRQVRILKAIIEEYIESAEPIGSEVLEKKYFLGVSPATVRNEMVKLTQSGYLKQPHVSAGRIPTKIAFRFYIDHLMEERKLSVADEVSAREKVWDSRFDFDKLMRGATHALADRSHMLAVAATDTGDVYHSGYANILNLPEFYDIDITKTVLGMIDEGQSLLNLFAQNYEDEAVHFLFGNELGYEFLEPCGLIFTRFEAGPDRSGSLGIIGPSRINYSAIVPLVKYFGQLVQELGQA
jgi:heat-inducible transcriptional repressor